MKCSLAEWNEFLAHSPDAHILQSGAWGELKSRFGWQPVRIINDNTGAQILFRRLPAGASIGYIAKGPVGGPLEALLPEIDEISRTFHAIFLKVEPDRWQTSPDDSIGKLNENWVTSKPIQPQRTVMVSLCLLYTSPSPRD